MKLSRDRRYLLGLLLLSVIARLGYRAFAGIRFNTDPLPFYLQLLDPPLLQHDLARSIFYLHTQPPLFNLFLGVILKLFPQHYTEAFAFIFFCGGLALTAALYQLMVRLRVSPPWSALVTGIFVNSPLFILYENWLFYTFPIAVMLTASALFLHRYLDGKRFSDAFAFFLLLALMALTRGIFHPGWMLVVVAAVLVVQRADRRQVARAALIPCLLLLAWVAKNTIVFHTLVAGRALQQMNMAVMTSQRLPQPLRQRLIDEHKLSPLANIPYISPLGAFRPYIPPPTHTGIPALDQEFKVGGWVNMNNLSYVDVGALYEKDSNYTLCHYPKIYVAALGENLARHLLPCDQVDPFMTRRFANARHLDPFSRLYNVVFSGQLVDRGIPWWHWIGMPLLLGFATFLVAGALLRRRRGVAFAPGERADILTIAYCLFCVVTVSAVTIILSCCDQNRMRFKISALYCLFVALFGQWLGRRLAQWRRERAATESVALQKL
jgi:hypothetical protein